VSQGNRRAGQTIMDTFHFETVPRLAERPQSAAPGAILCYKTMPSEA
jgi:hypothetical protein